MDPGNGHPSTSERCDRGGAGHASPMVALHASCPHLQGSSLVPMPSRQVGVQKSPSRSTGHVQGP